MIIEPHINFRLLKKNRFGIVHALIAEGKYEIRGGKSENTIILKTMHRV